MSDLTDYLPALAVGTQVSTITGNTMDGFTAGGFAAFTQAVTGQAPTVQTLDGKRARVLMTAQQAGVMRKWLDGKLIAAVKKPAVPPSLELELGPVLMPLALKYVIPTAVIFILIGWFGHHYLVR